MLKRKMVALALTVPMVLPVACKKSETTREVKDHSQEIITVSDSKETKASTSEEKLTTDDDVKMIDPFKDLKVNISGVEGFPEVTFDTSACDKIIQDNVEFSYETEDAFLNIGENIIVKAKLSSVNIDGTEYGLEKDSNSYEATSEYLKPLIHDENAMLSNSLRAYVEDEVLASYESEFRAKMMEPVETEKGTLQVEKCGDISINTFCSVLDMYSPMLSEYMDYRSKSGYPITGVFLVLSSYSYVTGTISETQEHVEDYKVYHYSVLYLGMPTCSSGVIEIEEIELFWEKEIEDFIKNGFTDTKEEYLTIESMIHSKYSEKIHFPSLVTTQIVNYTQFRVNPSKTLKSE